jgi:hypothetical protein
MSKSSFDYRNLGKKELRNMIHVRAGNLVGESKRGILSKKNRRDCNRNLFSMCGIMQSGCAVACKIQILHQLARAKPFAGIVLIAYNLNPLY